MIGGIIMIFAALWVYQSALKAKVSNVLMWVGVCVVAFFVTQTLLVQVNVYILELIRESESTAGYERDLTSIGDRKNEGGFQGVLGVLLSVFFELMPPLVAFLVVAIIRAKFVLKAGFSLDVLFGGFKEVFESIKQSFKPAEKE
ncbi:MAG: hypothetical protein CTY34_07570 [Methylobacter sp.]|nr:MAG: hypothetical protein CTY34_07570 [Methylobacter sp.]PPD19309.1 MAG: hypothetical protein CTY24_11150 [Methylobacter sp.]PPD34914.1 MAG: hypothetical protein CTY18_07545 [Methylomonas sp.]